MTSTAHSWIMIRFRFTQETHFEYFPCHHVTSSIKMDPHGKWYLMLQNKLTKWNTVKFLYFTEMRSREGILGNFFWPRPAERIYLCPQQNSVHFHRPGVGTSQVAAWYPDSSWIAKQIPWKDSCCSVFWGLCIGPSWPSCKAPNPLIFQLCSETSSHLP